MNEQDMIDSSRAVVLALTKVADTHQLGRDDRVSLACMALPEFIAQQIGPVAMVEHLRDLADVFERQFLD